MSDENKVNVDVTISKVKNKQLPPLSSIPLPIKSGIEYLQKESGLKNVGETVAIVIAALLGETVKADDWDGSPETAEAIGKALCACDAVKTALAQFEGERETRKSAAAKAAQIAKLQEMGITMADLEGKLA